MTTYLIGTDGPETSETLAAGASEYIDEDDAVYALNSVSADDGDAAAGEAALDVLADAFDAETRQIVGDTTPQEDLLAFGREQDVDGFVIGIRKRTPTGKVLFGSTAHDVLLETDRPVLTVPVDG